MHSTDTPSMGSACGLCDLVAAGTTSITRGSGVDNSTVLHPPSKQAVMFSAAVGCMASALTVTVSVSTISGVVHLIILTIKGVATGWHVSLCWHVQLKLNAVPASTPASKQASKITKRG